MEKSWIFQNNPKYYNLQCALKVCKEIHWQVHKNYQKFIEIRDIVYLWETGTNQAIYAVLEVLQKPQSMIKANCEDDFIKSSKIRQQKLRVKLRVDFVLSSPIYKQSLEKHPILKDHPLIRNDFLRGSNFKLDELQANALHKLIFP